MFRFCNEIAIVIIVCFSISPGDFLVVRSNGECLLDDGRRGICTNINECEPLRNLLVMSKSRPQPLILDLLRRSHCGFEGKYPVVCCPVAVKPKGNHKTLNVTIKNPTYEKFLNKSCGAIKTSDKVIGGKVTELNEFPWMALIRYKTRCGMEFRCGGSLITSRYVLTAAHCVTNLKDVYPTAVRLGEHNLESSPDSSEEKNSMPPEKDIAIEEVIPHPGYFKPELRNDIALIRLSKHVEFQDTIRPICLPIQRDVGERNLPADKAVIAGWGITELGRSSPVLKKVTVPIISLSECSKAYKRKALITESQICAGESGKDSCRGDSGGPLQVIGLNSIGEPAYIQQGIVSFGSRVCGTKGMPGVYTKVAYYIDWILKTVRE